MGARARLAATLKRGYAGLRARPRLFAGLQIAAVAILVTFLAYEFGDAVRDAWPRLRHADLKLVLLATNRDSYGHLCALITRGRMPAEKGSYRLARTDLAGGLPCAFC